MKKAKKRDGILRGADGQEIDWQWCLTTWDRLGRPVIYAAPNDPVYDLSLYIYPEKLSPLRLQGIVTWLEEHRGESVPKSLEVKPSSAPIHWSENFIVYQLLKHKEFAFHGVRGAPPMEPSLQKQEKPLVRSIRRRRVKPSSDFREFNLRFLLATQPYMPKVAKALVRECKEDLEIFGFEYTRKKWAKFVGMPEEGACPVCGASDWWYRPPSALGGPGGWLCAKCHPEPGKRGSCLIK